ncbi:unnamed protein product [Mytilus coruscus]|uniref:Mutator-like transposase domain-containing protein n=1 Tax=Mytilus coruscus TaxID=42192 RepID=A0A6J8ANJ9_MYTCO|nr:unnamed protein product [Mytilus coruscus]
MYWMWEKNHFETSPKLLNVGTRHYDINVRAVWGSIVSGNGLAHLNEQLDSMDSPTMAQNTFSVIEHEINQWWKVMVEEEMSSAIDLEKKIAIEKNRYHEEKQNLGKNQSNEVQTDVIDDNDDDNGDDDIFLQQSEMWTQVTSSSFQAQEQSRGAYMLCESDLQSGMRQDLGLLLNNVARKARSLIGNFTTNLAECWMHMRTKFDGGKMLNHCNRGAWHTRCYATALRFNKGPLWSPNVWEQATKSTPGVYFEKL